MYKVSIYVQVLTRTYSAALYMTSPLLKLLTTRGNFDNLPFMICYIRLKLDLILSLLKSFTVQ